MTNANKWLQAQERPSWLPKDDFPADPVCDFRTSNNESSVYELERSEDDAMKKKVAVALAANRISVDKLEYLLIDKSTIDQVGIAVGTSEKGKLPDQEISNLHRHLEKLSVSKLVALAKAILASDLSTMVGCILAKEVAVSVWQAIADGRFGKKVRPKLCTDAAFRILKAVHSSKASPDCIGKTALSLAAKHYLNELNAGRLDDKEKKSDVIEEAKKWAGN